MEKLLTTLSIGFFAITTIAQTPNTLTKKEVKEGWKLLFDGKTTAGWHTYNQTTIGEAWAVKDGCLKLEVGGEKDSFHTKKGGDIVTAEEYENYELSVDWKIAKDGNSGIIFNVVEDPKYQYAWHTGPEMQVLDNVGHPDAKIIKHRAADLYDLVTSSPEIVKPFGEWNSIRLINNKGLLQFYLNGTKVLETRTDDENWKNLIAGSKFKNMPAFGKSQKGRLCLQDHGNEVWFRNIKIRNI